MKINWLSFIVVIMSATMFSIIGLSLPQTINSINGFPSNHWYGTFASYIVSMILFYAFVFRINLLKEEVEDD